MRETHTLFDGRAVVARTVVARAHGHHPAAAIAHPLQGFGYLVPRRENRQILGTLFSSTLFPGRAPWNNVMLTSFIGGMRQPALAAKDDDAIHAMLREEHATLLGARTAPAFTSLKRWPRAIPQYTFGHLERVGQVEAAERNHPGLHFCCNYRDGVSLGDCIESASSTAARIGSFLDGHRVA